MPILDQMLLEQNEQVGLSNKDIVCLLHAAQSYEMTVQSSKLFYNRAATNDYFPDQSPPNLF